MQLVQIRKSDMYIQNLPKICFLMMLFTIQIVVCPKVYFVIFCAQIRTNVTIFSLLCTISH